MKKERVYFKMMSFMHETLYGLFRDATKVLRSAGLEAGQRVLEVGCGPGFFTVPTGEIVGPEGRVLSLDVNPIAVEHTARKARAARARNIEVVCRSAAETGEPAAAFDLAFVFGVAHPIGGMEDIWRELHRVVRPGGALAVEGRIQPSAELFRSLGRRGRMARYVRVDQ